MQNKNVLIIEDEESIQQLLKLLVEKRGAAATVASSSQEVANLLKEPGLRFNLIFLDLILPNVTGWDILEIIRSNPKTSDTPVIVLTGAVLSEMEKEKMLHKVNAVMEKTRFTFQNFYKVMEKWM